jgi:hypothetical protein
MPVRGWLLIGGLGTNINKPIEEATFGKLAGSSNGGAADFGEDGSAFSLLETSGSPGICQIPAGIC